VDILRESLNKVAINNKDGKIDISNTSFEYIEIKRMSNEKAIFKLNNILNKTLGIGIIIIITIAITPNATIISPNFIVFPPNNYLLNYIHKLKLQQLLHTILQE